MRLKVPTQERHGCITMKSKLSLSMVIQLLVVISFLGMVMTTHLLSNAFMMLIDRSNFIPAESSIFFI